MLEFIKTFNQYLYKLNFALFQLTSKTVTEEFNLELRSKSATNYFTTNHGCLR